MTTSTFPRRNLAPRWPFAALSFAVVLLVACELSIGQIQVPIADVWEILTHGVSQRESWSRVVLDFRLPRTITAIFASSAMAVSGLLLQTLFRNPLADAWALGLVHGSRFGVACFVVVAGAAGNSIYSKFGLTGDLALALASAIGGALALSVIALLSRRVGAISLLICGLMLGYFFIGAISGVLHLADEGHTRVFQSWDDGNFSLATLPQLQLAIPLVLLCVGTAYFLAKPLNALLLGETYAESLGVNAKALRVGSLTLVAAMTGLVTAYCGPISFLGIVVPHLARLAFRTNDHRTLIPATALLGAAVGLLADFFVHLPWRQHLFHLNAVNGLLGAPLVFWLILRRKNQGLLDS
jgi:iron complex transport system permease protein